MFFLSPVVWGLLLEWWGQEGEVDLQLVAEQRETRECICLPLVATLLMVSEVITLQCDQDGMEMDTAREEEDKKYVHLTFCHIKKLIHQLICWLFLLVWLNWYCIPLLLGLLKSGVISKVLDCINVVLFEAGGDRILRIVEFPAYMGYEMVLVISLWFRWAQSPYLVIQKI